MNVKQEFLEQTSKHGLLCAKLVLDDWKNQEEKTFKLPLGYTEDEYKTFLANIDRDYDNGYGTQELYGTIWHTETTWSGRCEYDGLEWWEYNEIPEIPPYLKKQQ